eukprot:scaffold78883_cov62-Phaeocystis_antarctica.AAC.1
MAGLAECQRRSTSCSRLRARRVLPVYTSCRWRLSSAQWPSARGSTRETTRSGSAAAEEHRLKPGRMPPAWSCQPPPVVSTCSTCSTACVSASGPPQPREPLRGWTRCRGPSRWAGATTTRARARLRRSRAARLACGPRDRRARRPRRRGARTWGARPVRLRDDDRARGGVDRDAQHRLVDPPCARADGAAAVDLDGRIDDDAARRVLVTDGWRVAPAAGQVEPRGRLAHDPRAARRPPCLGRHGGGGDAGAHAARYALGHRALVVARGAHEHAWLVGTDPRGAHLRQCRDGGTQLAAAQHAQRRTPLAIGGGARAQPAALARAQRQRVGDRGEGARREARRAIGGDLVERGEERTRARTARSVTRLARRARARRVAPRSVAAAASSHERRGAASHAAGGGRPSASHERRGHHATGSSPPRSSGKRRACQAVRGAPSAHSCAALAPHRASSAAPPASPGSASSSSHSRSSLQLRASCSAQPSPSGSVSPSAEWRSRAAEDEAAAAEGVLAVYWRCTGGRVGVLAVYCGAFVPSPSPSPSRAPAAAAADRRTISKPATPSGHRVPAGKLCTPDSSAPTSTTQPTGRWQCSTAAPASTRLPASSREHVLAPPAATWAAGASGGAARWLAVSLPVGLLVELLVGLPLRSGPRWVAGKRSGGGESSSRRRSAGERR